MHTIKNSYLSLIWRGIWGIILLEIPLFKKLAEIACLSYTYDKEKLYVKIGVFNKRSTIVPLYKIENVTCEANILGNGTIIISSQIKGVGCLYMNYVAHSQAETDLLNQAVAEAKKAKGFTSIDTF